ICSPCTTAPLSAILLYIAQSGNMWLGGGTLYLYALGMGLPLISAFIRLTARDRVHLANIMRKIRVMPDVIKVTRNRN
ncbi:cytochrome c biogenesis protein CcdA, partial [Escherichia coli]|uniref:cytochrome c biogenesis protein CcdA n=1 Tax=Escherichia coli TaxID=562 RepID=UPI00356B6C15